MKGVFSLLAALCVCSTASAIHYTYLPPSAGPVQHFQTGVHHQPPSSASLPTPEYLPPQQFHHVPAPVPPLQIHHHPSPVQHSQTGVHFAPVPDQHFQIEGQQAPTLFSAQNGHHATGQQHQPGVHYAPASVQNFETDVHAGSQVPNQEYLPPAVHYAPVPANHASGSVYNAPVSVNHGFSPLHHGHHESASVYHGRHGQPQDRHHPGSVSVHTIPEVSHNLQIPLGTPNQDYLPPTILNVPAIVPQGSSHVHQAPGSSAEIDSSSGSLQADGYHYKVARKYKLRSRH